MVLIDAVGIDGPGHPAPDFFALVVGGPWGGLTAQDELRADRVASPRGGRTGGGAGTAGPDGAGPDGVVAALAVRAQVGAAVR